MAQEIIYPRSVEQVRAELIAQIQHIRSTLTGEMRLSMAARMEAVRLSMYMEALITTASQEVPSFIARPHAEAYGRFMEKLVKGSKRNRKQKKA